MPATDPDGAPDDTRLMAMLAAGNDHALDQLMVRWKFRLTAFLSRMTGDPTVAIDLAQETFVKLYFARDRYRPSGKFPTFLFTIAANLARNHFRFLARHPTLSLDQPHGEDARADSAMLDPARGPDEHAAGNEHESEILAAIAALPDDQREAVALSLLEDFSITEIATIMGISPKSVDNKIYRARLKLRALLAHLAP